MRRLVLGAVPLALLAMFVLVDGCSDASEAGGASAGGGAGSAGDAAAPDAADGSDGAIGEAGEASDASDATDATDAGCANSAPDGAVTSVDAGAPLTIFDVGAADLRLDLSSDGSTALIEDLATGDVYFYDTASGTLTKKAHVAGDPSTVSATSLSGNGHRVGATHGATDIVGGVWDDCTGAWADLANTNPTGCAGPPNFQSGVFGLNADGTVAVGNVWNGCATSPTLWTESNGIWTPTPLEQLGIAAGSDRATVVSDDGKVIGGFAQRAGADRSPAIWTSSGTGTLLDPTGMVVGEVLAITGDGKMVAGIWGSADDAGNPTNTAFSWTSQDGVVTLGTLPNPQAQDKVWPVAIAANGHVILGSAGDPSWSQDLNGSEEFAIAWTQAKGMRKLQDIVTAQGIAIPAGYDLTGVSAASADGSVVLGFATDMNDPMLAQHTFVLRIAPAAYDQ